MHPAVPAHRDGKSIRRWRKRLLDVLGQVEAPPATSLLNGANPTPLYLQLQKVIQEWLSSGKLTADEALPSERDLARQLGI